MKRFIERENLGRGRRVLNYRALYDFPRPACAPIGLVPREIVRIFSAVNIYVIYGEFNEAYAYRTVISMTRDRSELQRVRYAGVTTTV